MKKKIILSFDYELFFGIKSGTVQKTLIEPTNLLLDCMDSVGAKGNFFIDYLMFERLEQLDDERAKSDLCLIKDQVKDMVRRGHRIELHLHPHWIDAKYNGDGTWDYTNYTHYSLYSLSKEEVARQFKDGVTYLTNLAREVDPNYKIVAFRAGGWTIQPFDVVKECFRENGIVIDSSVMRGACQDNKYSRYDFRDAPDKECYRFSDNVCKEDEKGEFIEVPITVYTKPVWLRVIDKVLSKMVSPNVCITDGSHKRYDLPESKKKLKFYEARRLSFTLSGVNAFIMYSLFILERKSLVTFIDHPKDFTMSALDVIKKCMKHADSITYIEMLKQN